MKNNNNKFDKELHDRLSTEELPFDPMAWEMMEEKLDKQPKRRFLFWICRFRYLIGSLSLILIAAITYWSFHYNNFDDRGHSEVVSIRDSKSNTTTEKNTTSEPSTITTNQSKVESPTSENNILSTPTTVSFTQENSNLANKSLSIPVNKVVNKKSEKNSQEIKKRSLTKIENSTKKSIGTEKKIVELENVAEKITSQLSTNYTTKATEAFNKNKKLNDLSTIGSIETSLFAYDREVPFDVNIVDIEQQIDRPKHQINMTIGGGMTQLDIDNPFVGDITPTAVANQELFASLSYIYRMHRNWGIEVGAQAAHQSQQIAHYFKAGDYDFNVSEYGKAGVKAYEGKYELFSNIHFFLPLNQRSELDIYGGFYALNPFSQPGGWGSGTGERSILNNNDVTLINSRVNGTSGIFNGGRLKVGINYNFLTNKLNNVGIGIAYMHEVNNVVEGTYSLVQNNEEARVTGNLRANPSGFKVQLTYGFGLKKFPWGKKKLNRPSPKSPWYAGIRYGIKNYILGDDLSRDNVNAQTNKYQSLHIGHYVNEKLAFEFGLESSEFVYTTPAEINLLINTQNIISVPLSLRYDLIQTDRISLYGKGVFTTDFRVIPQRSFTGSKTGYITDSSNLLLNTGIEAGIDFRILKGVNIGISGKYNKAFSRAYQIQYPELTDQNEVEFRDINLRNTYFSWGVELKYQFNRYKEG